MEQGLDFGVLLNNHESIGQIRLTAFDFTTDPCLTKPKATDQRMIGWIIFINVLCFLTCLLETYTSRWRSQICNMFYPNRANSRAKYLYKKIFTGRSRRRLEIHQICIKEKIQLGVTNIQLKRTENLDRAIKQHYHHPKYQCNYCNDQWIDSKQFR